MASTVTIRVDGLRELGERMRKLSEKVNKRLGRSSTNAGAQLVKKKAKSNIVSSPSVDTGSLRDSVIVKKVKSSLTSEHIVTVRGRGKTSKKTGRKQTEAPHARFVEYGTIHMPAEPFLRPAFESEQGAAVEEIKRKLEQGIIKEETR